MNLQHGVNSRDVAAEIVRRWIERNDFPDRVMGSVQCDRAFVMEVVYGTVKRKRQLEWVMKRCSRRLPSLPLRAYVMVGLYQIVDMDSVEPYAAVNETVTAIKSHFPQAQADYANALFRRACREKEALKAELRLQSLGVQTSHPEVLISRWVRKFGQEGTLRLCEWNNLPPEVVLRVNVSRIQLDDFLERLASSGVRAEPHGFSPGAFVILTRGVAPIHIPGYEDGWFSVQDPSTIMAVNMLGLKPRERVLDACAAPGGKLMAMADCMGGGESLVAMDVHEDRLMLLRENVERIGLAGVQVVQGDLAAGTVPGLMGQVFDAILLDVPCTNTGVLRRRADARWRFTEEAIRRVSATQHCILQNAASLLRKGGRIVYSTCSLEPEENEDQIALWLSGNPDFELRQQRSLFPPVDGVDGVYAALLVKR